MLDNLNENQNISMEEVKKFNWGAFLFGWIWGIFNKSYITLIQIPIGFIPVIGWILNFGCNIYFGIKGNEWALKNKTFESLEEFNKFQRKFVKVWFVIMSLNLLLVCLVYYFSHSSINVEKSHISIFCMQLIIQIYILLNICMFIILSSLKNIKKIISILVLFFGGLVILNLYTILNNYASYLVKQEKYSSAISIYNIMLTLDRNNFSKQEFNSKIGHCYLKMEDLDAAILSYEKAEERFLDGINMGDSFLTDLYILKGNIEKIKARKMMYKVFFINEDWDGVIKEATNRIDTATVRTQKDKNSPEYCADEKVYLARAFAYKKLGKLDLANKDFQIALSLASDRQKEEFEKLFNSNENYCKKYYEDLKKEFNLK